MFTITLLAALLVGGPGLATIKAGAQQKRSFIKPAALAAIVGLTTWGAWDTWSLHHTAQETQKALAEAQAAELGAHLYAAAARDARNRPPGTLEASLNTLTSNAARGPYYLKGLAATYSASETFRAAVKRAIVDAQRIAEAVESPSARRTNIAEHQRKQQEKLEEAKRAEQAATKKALNRNASIVGLVGAAVWGLARAGTTLAGQGMTPAPSVPKQPRAASRWGALARRVLKNSR